MPKVRVIDPKSGFRISVPIPYRLFINMFVRRSVVLKLLEGRIKSLMADHAQCPEDQADEIHRIEERIRRHKMLYLAADAFDFGELRMALTNTASYKGLVLVDIQAADGTVVHISL